MEQKPLILVVDSSKLALRYMESILLDAYDVALVELVKLFCNTYKEKFRQDHACILFSNGVIYPLDECG